MEYLIMWSWERSADVEIVVLLCIEQCAVYVTMLPVL